MVQCEIYILLILICPSSLYNNSVPCLTWEIIQERLTFTCRIFGFFHPVSLVDSQGQLYGKCNFSRHNHYCNPVDRKDLIDVHYSRKSIVFSIENFNESANGVWVCLQDSLRLTTQVSLSKGIIDATEIFITGTVLNTTIYTTKHAIKCFSCREPDGDNVEFLVNGRTEDSITYKHDTGDCTHHNGECHPDECSCNANMFQHAFHLELKNNSLLYTCEMLFTDSFTNAVFSKHISILFKEKGFYNKSTSTKIIKPGYTIWSRPFTTNEIVTELESTQTTVTGDNITVENIAIYGMTTLIVLFLMVCILVIPLIFIKTRKWLISRQHLNSRHYSQTQTDETVTSIADYLPKPVDETVTSIAGNSSFGVLSNWLVCGSYDMQSDERPALFFCINCEEAHCGICSRKHSLVKQTSDHKCFSMNMVTTNVLLTITCGYHKQMKFQYYCLCHNVLCCNKCITVSHRDQECSLVELDSNAVMERADVSERNINECLDYLIGMNMYLYHNIEEITNSLTLSELSIEKDEKSREIQKRVTLDANRIKREMHNYASEIGNLIYFVRDQKDVFDFIKEHGSERQLFIMQQRMNELDEIVRKMIDKSKRLTDNVERLRRNRVVPSTISETAYRELRNMSLS